MPSPPDGMLRFNCPACDRRLKVPESQGGKKGRCPSCKELFTTPSPVSLVITKPSAEEPVPPPIEVQYIHIPPRPKHEPRHRAKVVEWAYVKCQCNYMVKVPKHKGVLDIECPGCEREWAWNPETDDSIPIEEVKTATARRGRRDPPPPRSSEPPPLNYPAVFVWWCSQFPSNLFPFPCTCGVVVPLRSRVVQSRRACPGCGREITLGAIDACLVASEPKRRRALGDD